jgi:hypothetical protein
VHGSIAPDQHVERADDLHVMLIQAADPLPQGLRPGTAERGASPSQRVSLHLEDRVQAIGLQGRLRQQHRNHETRFEVAEAVRLAVRKYSTLSSPR